MNNFKINKNFQKNIKTTLTIPGDKSISHRVVIVGSIAKNNSIFENFLFSEDCLNTVKIFQQLGIEIEISEKDKRIAIQGKGLHGLKEPEKTLDVGNSGTGIRLIAGILGGQNFNSVISGDSSIQKRPMRRIIDPLTRMGCSISGQKLMGKDNIFPPLEIQGQSKLKGIEYTLPVASAQVKSAILFASLYSKDQTIVTEPEKCRDHTERILAKFGAGIAVKDQAISCSGQNNLRNPSSEPIFIPSDISSAAFFIALGCLMPDSEIKLLNIGLNPTRNRFVDVMLKMGANIFISELRGTDFEPYADITVKTSSLTNIELEKEDIPFLIDEIPILAVVAMFGHGIFKVTNAKELRVKESDRIAAIANLVKNMGGKIKTFEDGFEIEGKNEFIGFEVDSYGDHRIAMSAIIGAISANVSANVINCECIKTSFPGFFEKVLGTSPC